MKAGEFEHSEAAVQKSTLVQATLICVTLLFTELTVLLTTAQATSGASTLCTILRTRLEVLGITHSLPHLSLNSRPLYDWVINNISVPNKPRQIEFARLGINNTVMSKRKLRELFEKNYVSGWDDPRMPTLCDLKKRLYPLSLSVSFTEQMAYQR